MRSLALIGLLAAAIVAAGFLTLRVGAEPETKPAPPLTQAVRNGTLVGMMDDAQVLTRPRQTMRELAILRVDVIRMLLRWNAIAPTRPREPERPADPAYEWDAYDRAVRAAERRGITVLFTVFGAPPWTNGGRDWRYAPQDADDLRAFALAAARRYSGTFRPSRGPILPRVSLWLAWNEPNLSFFLRPSGGEEGASVTETYADMCTAVWEGVHEAGDEADVSERVACGVTSPRQSRDDSLEPIEFLQLMAEAGARFDVYAHNAHSPSRAPGDTPDRGVTLGNIDTLLAELDRLYGPDMRLWITEYGYQTKPPDPLGVSYRKQAEYLREAFAIVRRHPRIDMLVWFLLKDEPDRDGAGPGVPGWQSGLRTVTGRKKPSYRAFEETSRRIHARS